MFKWTNTTENRMDCAGMNYFLTVAEVDYHLECNMLPWNYWITYTNHFGDALRASSPTGFETKEKAVEACVNHFKNMVISENKKQQQPDWTATKEKLLQDLLYEKMNMRLTALEKLMEEKEK